MIRLAIETQALVKLNGRQGRRAKGEGRGRELLMNYPGGWVSQHRLFPPRVKAYIHTAAYYLEWG